MKYPTFSFIALVLAFSVECNAQGESSDARGKSCERHKSCERYKIDIVTPSKDIDFTIIVMAPPKNIDQAMIVNPCPEQSQLASAPQILVPSNETDELSKELPFIIKKRSSP